MRNEKWWRRPNFGGRKGEGSISLLAKVGGLLLKFVGLNVIGGFSTRINSPRLKFKWLNSATK